MNARCYVIVNADDLGLSPGVNKGIAHAHGHGIVTSASLMVLQPAAEDAAVWAGTQPGLSVGIHLDLCEWEYRVGGWVLKYQRVALDDPAAVATEVARQLARFGELVGTGPTHIDSHQHIHRSDPAAMVIAAEATSLGVPLRERSPARFVGGFYGQTNRGAPCPDLISPDALIGLLASVGDGWSEVACHPGYAEDTTSSYRNERRLEVETLCHPDVRAAVETLGIELRNFGDLR